MPRRPHPDRSRALSLLREGHAPKEVLRALPGVSHGALYGWMEQEGIATPGVRDRLPSDRNLEILSMMASNPGVSGAEVAAMWRLRRQRIGQLGVWLEGVDLDGRG